MSGQYNAGPHAVIRRPGQRIVTRQYEQTSIQRRTTVIRRIVYIVTLQYELDMKLGHWVTGSMGH